MLHFWCSWEDTINGDISGNNKRKNHEEDYPLHLWKKKKQRWKDETTTGVRRIGVKRGREKEGIKIRRTIKTEKDLSVIWFASLYFTPWRAQ